MLLKIFIRHDRKFHDASNECIALLGKSHAIAREWIDERMQLCFLFGRKWENRCEHFLDLARIGIALAWSDGHASFFLCVKINHLLHLCLDKLQNLFAQRIGLVCFSKPQQLITARIHNLTMLVQHVVVFQQVFARIKVVTLQTCLRLSD